MIIGYRNLIKPLYIKIFLYLKVTSLTLYIEYIIILLQMEHNFQTFVSVQDVRINGQPMKLQFDLLNSE